MSYSDRKKVLVSSLFEVVLPKVNQLYLMITNSQLSNAFQFDAFVNDQNINFVRLENSNSSNNTAMDQPDQIEHGKRSKTIDFDIFKDMFT